MDPSLAGQDAREYGAEHEVLRAFVNKRAGAPTVGEQVKGIHPYGRYLSLHHGRSRAVTVWDESHDVCWLVAFSQTHDTGADDDCYRYFMNLGERGELLPTPDDYELLEAVVPGAYLDQLVELSLGLYEEARATPNKEFNETFGGGSTSVVIDVIVIDDEGELESGWISIGFANDTPLTEHTALDVVARILPQRIVLNAGLHLADSFGPNRRPPRHDELIFMWEYSAVL